MKKILTSIFLAVLVLCSCTSKNAKKGEKSTKTLVKVEIAQKEKVNQLADFTGTIRPFYVNKISSSMGLRIEHINVEVGDKVKKGELLVKMDKRQYLQASIQLSNLEIDFSRIEKLYEEGGASKQQLDQLKTQLDVARHALNNLKENVDLVSPINGVVTERMYDEGDLYSPSVGRILTVMQMNKVKVRVNVSEEYFPRVKMGMPVNIHLEVYPNKIFKGNVTLIYPALDATTRTFMVEITIPNKSLTLRPGMYSRVSLNFGNIERILIPDVAVQKQIGSNEHYSFVIKDSIAERRVIKRGRIVGDKIEILSGINEGESVVIAGGQRLLDKGEVTIIK
ncbi:MAG: efflux RND transporter periplasmic adaptor subunit [Bacteroidetes bacterium]|nr:efflux RND transporter periplasmic adaptor subunit [Bacteroidota bacterium]